MAKVSVHVQDSDNSPVDGAKVFLDIASDSTWLEDFTNGNGDVDFEVPDYCEINISVNGNVEANISVTGNNDEDVTIEL